MTSAAAPPQGRFFKVNPAGGHHHNPWWANRSYCPDESRASGVTRLSDGILVREFGSAPTYPLGNGAGSCTVISLTFAAGGYAAVDRAAVDQLFCYEPRRG